MKYLNGKRITAMAFGGGLGWAYSYWQTCSGST
jgi:hypothetical protein